MMARFIPYAGTWTAKIAGLSALRLAAFIVMMAYHHCAMIGLILVIIAFALMHGAGFTRMS